MERNYLQTVARGSWWNYLQYIFSIGTAFILSIVLTRYFSPSIYGIYTYIFFVINTLVLALNFGLTTTLQTFLPPLHFTEKISERNSTFRQLLKIQLIIIGSGLVILLPLASQWHKITSFQLPNFWILIGLAILLSIMNVTINFFATLFSSMQRFRLLSKVNIASQLLSFVAALMMVFWHQQILFILLLTVGINLTILGWYFWLSRDLWGSLRSIVSERVQIKKMFGFSMLAYINILLQLVIWDRSEFFFLGKLQTSDQLAIYGIAYTVSLMFVGLLDPIMNTFVSVLSELVGKNDWERIHIIIEKTSKYAGIVFLPVIILLFFYAYLPITFIYGKQFLNVGIILPWLTLSALISRAFIPAWALTTYKHDLRAIIKIELGIAVVNILLDIVLIPKFGYIGAAWANCVTQIVAVICLMIFVRKYQVRLIQSSFVRLLILNGLLFGILALIKQLGLSSWAFLGTFLVSSLAYVYFVLKFFIHSDDMVFLSDFGQHSPAIIRPVIRILTNGMQRLKTYVGQT